MKTLYIVLVALLVSSCGNPMIPLKSDYSKIEKTFVSKYNREETWSKLLDVLVKAEMPIDIVDKSSGLLVSKQVDMSNVYTYEDDNGKLVDDSKMIVLSQYKTIGVLEPTQLTGTWNIRVTESSNQVAVSVNLVNLKAIHYTPINAYSPVINYDAKSTGTLEGMIKKSISF